MISSGYSLDSVLIRNKDFKAPIWDFYKNFCDHIGISYGVALDMSRKHENVTPRKLFCWFARANSYTLREISDFFGYRDHTSVLEHQNDHKKNLFDQRYRDMYDALSQGVGYNKELKNV